MKGKRNWETKEGMEGEGWRERDRGREINGVERKSNWETEEGMEGEGEGVRERGKG